MRLGDFISINPESIQKDYPFYEIEYIEISSVGTGILRETKLIKLNTAPSRAKRIVKKGDTLLATVRPNLRSFWYAKNPGENTVASTGFAVLRAGEKIDSRFLYYTVTNQSFTDYLTANAKGAAYPAVDIETIARAEIYLPPLYTQRKIAAILSSYDDLIENNYRRIKILEEMAQALYREWFVHFRFPGHEKVRLVDSPLGKIPEGWRVEKLGNIIELNYGKGLPKEKRREGCVPVYGSSGIVGYHDRSIVDGPGIIVGRKGNVGSVFWSDTDFYPIDTVYYVSSELPLRYLFYDLQTRNFINNDAAVPGLNRKQAYSLETILPTPELMDKFCNITEAFGKQASILRNKNEILRRTRDLLLPKLISGEIDVSELDIKVPEELD